MVQYFQFDKDGNMFVFEPGSGFSGPAMKVEPGFFTAEVYDKSQKYSWPTTTSDSGCDNSGDAFCLSQVSSALSTIETEVIQPTPIKRLIYLLF